MLAFFHFKKILVQLIAVIIAINLYGQTAVLKGRILSDAKAIPFASIEIKSILMGSIADSIGNFKIKDIPTGTYKVSVSAIGYNKMEQIIQLKQDEIKFIEFSLSYNNESLNEVVISGTMLEVSKLQSAVPIEVYTAKFFKSNPNPSIFEALQGINGVRPQINCNVCNTGDIHINGLEGPYTMVLIDGMPIVSGLSTVYGLNGIPKSLIERVEVVKGPASTLYGSEAVGGLINIITKSTTRAPLFSVDVFSTSWAEVNTDISSKFNAGKKAISLVGVNYFNSSVPFDKNKDGFTDITLQNRISLFNKWDFKRKNDKILNIAGRYINENRWGGDINWTEKFRGGDSIYGESIYTNRWELLSSYQLPLKEYVMFQFSANGHYQNSVYGNLPYLATQIISFGQLIWNKQFNKNDILLGAAFRYNYYDDNTAATLSMDSFSNFKNTPSITKLPGMFLQDELTINAQNKLLFGLRYDYNSIHGNIFTPRINYKLSSKNQLNILRFSIGNGYRVANVFTEDHAALTGARKVEFLNDLKPETSWNANINFVKKRYTKNGNYFGIDATAFYTYFNNKIIANYDSDPNKIIYNNLNGYAISQGISLNLDMALNFGLKANIGASFLDVYNVNNKLRTQQLFTEKISGVWNISYTINTIGLVIDYTGNLYSPMRLPLLSSLDPRKEYSPWWSIQNIQLTKKVKQRIEIYGGVKNLLNWTPNKGNLFIIARANDPFDKQVQFDSKGMPLTTLNNPYALTFDPTYVYAPNQGIRFFLGFRYSF